jgi:hypothetical protein
MAADAVYSAIVAYLAANTASLADPVTGDIPYIRYENDPLAPPDTKPWVAVALTGQLYSQQSIGAATQADNRWDERGHLWLPVFVQTGSGAVRARQLAKQLADLFRGQRLVNDTLEFMDAFIDEGAPAQEDGNWFRIPVAIEWRRFEA